MDLPLNADVSCADGPGGRSTTIILNPIKSVVTHIVVKKGPNEYVVSLDLIVSSTPNHIQLRCTGDELEKLDHFVKMRFIGGDTPGTDLVSGMDVPQSAAVWWPYAQIDGQYIDLYQPVEEVPHDELAIHRGSEVRATDGHIGRIDEFIVNPVNYHLSHLVLRKNKLFGHRDVTVPVDHIGQIDQDIVYLNVDKAAIEALPDVPTSSRYWR